MKRKFLLVCAIMVTVGCTTTENAARRYFETSKTKGVEPFDAFMERMKKEQKLRDTMYGQAKAQRLIQCTVLRNQLYVAALKGAPADVIDATKSMENAYQENDDSFLATCNQIINTEVGKSFMVIQQEYMINRRGS